MNQSQQPAIHHLFRVSSLEDVSRELLEQMTEEYPCFGFGHYLLSRKLRAGNPEQFLEATQKTSLYFPNPYWLQWMLENEAGPARSQPILRTAAAAASQRAAPSGPWPEMTNPTPPADTVALQSDPEAPVQEEGEAAAALLMDSIEKARELRQSLQKINEDFVIRTGHPIPAPQAGADEAAEPVAERVAEAADEVAPAEPIHTAEPIQDDSIETEPIHTGESIQTEPIQTEPIHTAEPIQDEESPFILEEQEQPAATAETVQTEPSPSASPPPPSPTPLTPASDTAPLFEPLHTIDYFASQGIRFTPEDNPTDQLGRQLKSFTEWLRMMRRLPQRDREIIPDRVAEEAVQNFAAHSIEGREVVTETMAEVLAKQGMPERARIMYEKLCLLNPDKSAYFAAKIEQLNSP